MRMRIEDMKRRIAELESSNQTLGHRSSELQVNLQEQGSAYQSQLAGKDREIEYLKKEIVDIRKKYEDIYGTKLEDLAEVKVYSGLIMPEIQRLSKATDKRKHRSKSRSRKTSISSDDERKNLQLTTSPSMHYQIQYDQGTQTLVVTIIKCMNLQKTDMMGGKPDPMVNIFLRPGHHKTIKTKIIKSEQNPQFNEVFRFQMSPSEVSQKMLVLQVVDWDRFSKNDPLGEVKIALNQVDLVHSTNKISPLQVVSEKASSSDEDKKHNGHLGYTGESLI